MKLANRLLQIGLVIGMAPIATFAAPESTAQRNICAQSELFSFRDAQGLLKILKSCIGQSITHLRIKGSDQIVSLNTSSAIEINALDEALKTDGSRLVEFLIQFDDKNILSVKHINLETKTDAGNKRIQGMFTNDLRLSSASVAELKAKYAGKIASMNDVGQFFQRLNLKASLSSAQLTVLNRSDALIAWQILSPAPGSSIKSLTVDAYLPFYENKEDSKILIIVE